MVRRSGYATFALFAVMSAAGTARAQTPPPAEEPPPAADAPPAAAGIPTPPPPPASSSPFAPFKIDSNGNSLRIGLLIQPTFRAANSANSALSGYSENMFLRRTRILVGGTLFGMFDYFIDTDYPNLFLATPAGNPNAMTDPTNYSNTKGGPGMYIQDAFITAKPLQGGLKDAFKVDVGFMLPPMAHNALQGAGTLYSLDYYSYTFQHQAAFQGSAYGTAIAPAGRDLGVQVRGLVVGGHIEYRVGLFQGVRVPEPMSMDEVPAHNFFRATGRLQFNVFDAEPGFFYAGTYLGAKRILSFGISGDLQDKYKYFAGDVFLDMPIGPGVLTGQVNYGHWDGGTFITSLPKQWAVMGEVGYNVSTLVSPIVRVEHQVVSSTDTATNRYGGGLAFWPFGHNSNLKLFYQRIKAGTENGFNQVDLQWQLYFY